MVEVKEIDLGLIVISQFNTRKDLDAGTEDTSLDDLASSIKEKGLLNPITVIQRDDAKYDLVAGQRRFIACRRLQMKTIPAIIRQKMDDADATILSLIENVHRADMNPMDKARAYRSIYDKYRNYDLVAKETFVSIPTIKRYISLLNLSTTIQDRITTSDGVAGIESLSKLAQIFKPEDQEKVLEQIGAFRQNIQVEIIKQSQGNLGKITELRQLAMEGAFDTVMCREGLCFDMPEQLKTEVKKFLRGDQTFQSFKDKISLMKF